MTNWIDLFKGALGLDADKKNQAERERVISVLRNIVGEMSQAVNQIDRRMSLALIHYGKFETVQIVISKNNVALGTCVSVKLADTGYPLHIVSAGSKKIADGLEFEEYMKEVVTEKESKLIGLLKETLMPDKEVESLNYHIPTATQRKALEMKEGNPPPAPAKQLEAPAESDLSEEEIVGNSDPLF